MVKLESTLPQSKAELLDRMAAERTQWDDLIARVPGDAMSTPGVAGAWSVKDVIAHIAGYEQWTAAHLRAERIGVKPTNRELYGTDDIPPDAETADVDTRNDAMFEFYKGMPLAEAQAFAQQAFEDLVAAVDGLTEEQLRDPNGGSWWAGQPQLQSIPKQSYEHYAQHRDDLQRWVARQS